MSQITTHILDITKGRPAAGVRISLYRGSNDDWTEMSWGTTDSDGRIRDLVKTEEPLQTGIYKLRFETKDYFDKDQIATFYPFVEIIFDLTTQQHYHIPLLLSPFGYSTYRGT